MGRVKRAVANWFNVGLLAFHFLVDMIQRKPKPLFDKATEDALFEWMHAGTDCVMIDFNDQIIKHAEHLDDAMDKAELFFKREI